jgi:hypothetical protein
MSNNNDFGPIIALLEARYVEAQKNADKELAALNVVREATGLPPRAMGVETSKVDGAPVLTQIKRDTFYGKKLMTAVREYLEMRKIQGDGPATPREVLEALLAGGYPFETKSDDISLVGVRALLRKANNVFHKLPNTGTYGLLAWYPNAKPGRDDDESHAKGAKKRGRPRKGGGLKRHKPKTLARPESEDEDPEIDTAANE